MAAKRLVATFSPSRLLPECSKRMARPSSKRMLASAKANEEAGGPKIPKKYGRLNVSVPKQCPAEGRLLYAGPPSPAGHLRDDYIIFYREPWLTLDKSTEPLHNLLNQVLEGCSSTESFIRSYMNNSFAARLTVKEKDRLAGIKGVVSVAPQGEKRWYFA